MLDFFEGGQNLLVETLLVVLAVFVFGFRMLFVYFSLLFGSFPLLCPFPVSHESPYHQKGGRVGVEIHSADMELV